MSIKRKYCERVKLALTRRNKMFFFRLCNLQCSSSSLKCSTCQGYLCSCPGRTVDKHVTPLRHIVPLLFYFPRPPLSTCSHQCSNKNMISHQLTTSKHSRLAPLGTHNQPTNRNKTTSLIDILKDRYLTTVDGQESR